MNAAGRSIAGLQRRGGAAAPAHAVPLVGRQERPSVELAARAAGEAAAEAAEAGLPRLRAANP